MAPGLDNQAFDSLVSPARPGGRAFAAPSVESRVPQALFRLEADVQRHQDRAGQSSQGRACLRWGMRESGGHMKVKGVGLNVPAPW